VMFLMVQGRSSIEVRGCSVARGGEKEGEREVADYKIGRG